MLRPVKPTYRWPLLSLAGVLSACVPLPSTPHPKAQPSAREQAQLAVFLHLASLKPDAGAYVVSEKGQAPSEFVMKQLSQRSGPPFVEAPRAQAKPPERHPLVSLDVWNFDWTRGDQPSVEASYDVDGAGAVTCRFNLSQVGGSAEFRVLPNPIPACSR
jgi:hypothetical protein